MRLPGDSHVHTEWSWDAADGDMRATCAQAVAVGLPSVAFTEHVDHTAWRVAAHGLAHNPHLAALADDDGRLRPPPFDAVGYLAAVERCRAEFPGLRILSGMELGEPHRHESAVRDLLDVGEFDRVLGSLHSLPEGRGPAAPEGPDGFAEPTGLWEHRAPVDVVRDYLAEVVALVTSPAPFSVLAHVDYPVRGWPASARPFDPLEVEDEFRHALRATAESGRALEVNTRVPLHDTLLGWWREEGGTSITFGSDAHSPRAIARGFAEAVQMAEAHGFRAGRLPHEVWGIG